MKPRTIKPLLYGTTIQINPADWLQVAGVKTFDEKTTQILRAFRNPKSGAFLLYAMRGANGHKAAEAYELVPSREFVEQALQKVAAHCGIEALHADVCKEFAGVG